MLQRKAFLIFLYGLSAAMLMSSAGGGPGISLIPSAWAAPVCTDADIDGYDKYHPKWCPEGNDPDDSDPCIGPDGPIAGCDGGGGNTAPDPYNLARASFATREELGTPDGSVPDGGVFADGVYSCDDYDYWDWQEALLPDPVGLDCGTYLNSSNVSGGGRWFLLSGPAGSEEVLDKIERWLEVDFSVPSDPSSPCYNLDFYDGSGTPPAPDYSQFGIPLYLTGQILRNPDDCIDNLAIRLSADRILKAKANQQQLEFSIRWRPDPAASSYWPPWGYVSYIQPLFLRDPSENLADPFHGRNCRVMSTRETYYSVHTRAEAELLREIGPGQTQLLGTYYLPLEVCVKRASD